jgi:hypothetical protein
MGASASSEHRWPQIKTWLVGCDENHSGCRSPSALLWKPKWLVGLGNYEYDSIRLVVSDKHFRAIPHCVSPLQVFRTQNKYMTSRNYWGTSNILRPLSSNAVSLQQSILSDAMPETFKVAISITRRLGVRYL